MVTGQTGTCSLEGVGQPLSEMMKGGGGTTAGLGTDAAGRRGIFGWLCYLHKYQLYLMGFPGGTSGKEPAGQRRRHETRVRFLGREGPLEEGMAIHSGILPGESHGQRSPVGYRILGRKEVGMTEAT